MNQPPSPFDEALLKRTLGYFASGLTVITATLDGRPVGMTCQSFTSVSLDPPLVGVFLQSDSSSWMDIRSAGHVAINVLGASQHAEARTFGTPGIDKFRSVSTTVAPNGAPLLDGAIAWFTGPIVQTFEAGDHDGALVRVEALATPTAENQPLIFFRGGYGQFSS